MENDEILHKWLNGELSEEEEKAFQLTEEYAELRTIIHEVDTWEKPSWDSDQVLACVLASEKKVNTGRVIPWFVWTAAAGLAILLGVFWWINQMPLWNTPVGETSAINLSEGIEVQLNSGSILKQLDAEGKHVSLNGEAFFSVQGAQEFLVGTPLGQVQVLGTEFNVNVYKKSWEISCHEGQIWVTTVQGQTMDTLSEGEAIKVRNDDIVGSWKVGNQSSWISGKIHLREIPLYELEESLERYFPYDFIIRDLDLEERISFSYDKENLDATLQAIETLLVVRVTQNQDEVIISK